MRTADGVYRLGPADQRDVGRAGAAPVPADDERLLRLSEVIERTGLSRSSIYSYIARGMFPRPTRIGQRASRWPKSAVDQWISAQIHASIGASGGSA